MTDRADLALHGSESKDADGSVTSNQTQTTQTRFSFYNAQDFVQQETPDGLKMASPTRKQQPPPSDIPPPDVPSISAATRDSVEILRSLQEHEQQRLEILGTSVNTVGQHPQQQQPNIGNSKSNSGSASFRLELTAESAAGGSDSSNPYEDAIKEALDLLRKHRATATPHEAATPAVSNVMANPAISGPLSTKEPLQQHQLYESLVAGSGSRTPPEADQILQSRGEMAFFPSETTATTKSHPQRLDAGPTRPKQNGSNGPSTPSAVALGEAYQAEIEARRKQRQERMARYATRLAELKQEDKYTSSGVGNSSSAVENKASSSDVGQPSYTGPRLDAIASSWQHPTQAAMQTSRSEPSNFHSDNNASLVSSGISKEEDVQRGVERVLLAILERANSQGRGGRNAVAGDQIVEPSMGLSADGTTTTSPWASTSREEKKASSPIAETRPSADEGDNALMRAMTDLLGAPSTSTLGSSSPNRNAMQNFLEQSLQPHLNGGAPPGDQQMPSTISGPGKNNNRKTNLTVDTSFASKEERGQSPEDDLDKMVRTVLIQDTAEMKQKKDDSFDRRVRSVLSPDPDKQHAANSDKQEVDHVEQDDYQTQGSGTDHDDDDEGTRDEEYDDEDDDDSASNEEERNANNHGDLDGVLGPLSKAAGGTTGVVLESDPANNKDSYSVNKDSYTSPSLLDSISAAVSLVAGTLTSEKSDKYAPSDTDEETFELMRTLCAHLLPTQAARSSGILEKRPDWDEANPDEAGYRIIRLTTVQLASIEVAFEGLSANLKPKKSDSSPSESENDEPFERDLKAAEDALDGHERGQIDKGGRDLEIAAANRAQFYPEQQPLPGFPGVKSTGRGEMGDLEYFHLPIIFKSHVTGFEPTKDLVLESGNVVAGQYLVEGELGSAAFSTAYRCVDLNSDGDGPDGHEEVCLKVIKNTKDFFDQSLDEIKILELLRQTGMCQEKNLVEMRTFFYHREHLIIVTELLRQNLFEFGKFIIDSDEEPYFTMPRLCFLTRQILVALDFVHRLGLVHSDVKPENILLSSYSRAQVKLIDFGSSCFLTDRQSSYIQSRSYRAPEVILGLPYDGRIDIWSLGCVVAEMFTGEVTFQNDSIVSMLSRIEAICGTFPTHMIAQGRQSRRFFTKCGLLFEKLPSDDQDTSHSEESDEDDDTSTDRRKRYVDVFQPKVTTLSARMGFSSDLMRRYDNRAKMSREENRQAVFVDFVRQLLTIDPDKRPSAAEALNHPWMKVAEGLTEEEIKYPSF